MINHKAPFVIPFKVLGDYYAFDVNTNQIITISKELYEIFCTNIELYGEISDTKIQTEILELIENGYLSNKRAKCIQHPADIFLKSHLENYLENMTLQVTQSCNMRCRYCTFTNESNYDRPHGIGNMSWETAKAAIDFLHDHSSYSKDICIGFYGGEPFLNYSLIKKTIEYAEEIFASKELSFKITTNGTVLNDAIIDLINQHNFYVCLSLDGPKRYHDKNRKLASNGNGTFDIVANNLSVLKKSIKNYQYKLSINSVIDQEENLNEYISFFDDANFSNINIEYQTIDTSLLSFNIIQNDYNYIREEVNKIKFYLELILNSDSKLFMNRKFTEELEKLKNDFSCYDGLANVMHHNGPCVPGYTHLMVTLNGDIYPCEKVSENSNCLKIGDLKTGFDIERIHNLLNIGKLTEEECMNCEIIRHCNICAKDIDNIKELDINIKRNKCMEQKIAFYEKLKKYVLLKKAGIIFSCQ